MDTQFQLWLRWRCQLSSRFRANFNSKSMMFDAVSVRLRHRQLPLPAQADAKINGVFVGFVPFSERPCDLRLMLFVIVIPLHRFVCDILLWIRISIRAYIYFREFCRINCSFCLRKTPKKIPIAAITTHKFIVIFSSVIIRWNDSFGCSVQQKKFERRRNQPFVFGFVSLPCRKNSRKRILEK